MDAVVCTVGMSEWEISVGRVDERLGLGRIYDIFSSGITGI